jgi:RND family efflux transporter MFP subunit
MIVKSHYRWTGLGVVIAGLLALFVSCGSPLAENLEDEAVAAAPSARPIAVHVYVVPASAEARARMAPAIVSADSVAIVLAKRDGTLVHLLVEEGASVAEGQAIAQLDDGESRFLLQQAELELTRTRVEAEQANTHARAERVEYDRQLALFKYGLVSRRDVDQARRRFESARLDAEKSRVAVQMASGRLRAEDERINIRAPFAGVVTRRYARLGNSVQRGDRLFEVTQSGPIQIRFDLAEPTGASLEVGALVDLLDSSGGQVVGAARVDAVRTAEIGSNSRTYLAEVIDGAGLAVGKTLTVRLPGAAEETAHSIPRDAFPVATGLVEGGSATIYVVSADGTCRERTVRVEAVIDDLVQVGSGPAVGERIVLAPPPELRSGAVVDVLSVTASD